MKSTKERVRKPVQEGTAMVVGTVAGIGEGIRNGLVETIGRGGAWLLLMFLFLGIVALIGAKAPEAKVVAERSVERVVAQAAPVAMQGGGAPVVYPTAGPARTGGYTLREMEVPYKEMFIKAGEEFDIPWQIIAGLAQAESAMNPKAVSSDGYASRGLCQFIPTTWTEVTAEWGYSWDDAFDPEKNVRAAAKYLDTLRAQVAKPGMNEADIVYAMLCAFNWGPGNVRQHGADGAPARTRAYAAGILRAAGYLD